MKMVVRMIRAMVHHVLMLCMVINAVHVMQATQAATVNEVWSHSSFEKESARADTSPIGINLERRELLNGIEFHSDWETNLEFVRIIVGGLINV